MDCAEAAVVHQSANRINNDTNRRRGLISEAPLARGQDCRPPLVCGIDECGAPTRANRRNEANRYISLADIVEIKLEMLRRLASNAIELYCEANFYRNCG
jgi:hypothetical protein